MSDVQEPASSDGETGEGQEKNPFWVRRQLTRQNFEFEILAARSEISLTKEALNAQGADKRARDKKVLGECDELLRQVTSAFRSFFARELFIWQILFLIRQKLLLVIPFSKLGAKWITLEKRVSKIGEKEAGRWGDKKFREEVGKKLAEKAPERVEESDKLREELQEMRKFLDDRIILELWSGLRLRRYGTLFIILAVLLSGFLIALVCYPEFGCLFYDCVAAGKGVKKHSIIGMVVAGALGALVSALANAAGSGDESAPPLADVSLVRPVIGAISGLFLYLLSEMGVFKIEYPALYATAIAFGFTERAFYNTLRNLSGSAERKIRKGMN